MSDRRQRNEPKEKTPKGLEVPVPKRSEFLKNLRKVAKTDSQAKGSPKQ